MLLRSGELLLVRKGKRPTHGMHEIPWSKDCISLQMVCQGPLHKKESPHQKDKDGTQDKIQLQKLNINKKESYIEVLLG